MSNIPAGVKVSNIAEVKAAGQTLVNAVIEAKLPNGSTWDALQRGLVPDYQNERHGAQLAAYLEAYLQASFDLIKNHLVSIRYRKIGSEYLLMHSVSPSIYPAHTLEWAMVWNGHGDHLFTLWQPLAAMVDSIQPVYATEPEADDSSAGAGKTVSYPAPGPHGDLDHLTD